MKTLILTLVCFVLLLTTSPNVAAQNESPIFNLPDGQTGKPYRADLAAVLREKYRMKLEASSQEAKFLWAFAGGELPLGLAVDPHGIIVGTPEATRENNYQFVLRVREEPDSDGLRITFSIQL